MLLFLMILVYVVFITPCVVLGFLLASAGYEVIGFLCLLLAFAARETAYRFNTELIYWWVRRFS